MHLDQLRRFLENPDEAVAWFRSLGLGDGERAQRGLANIASLGVPLDLLAAMADQLAEQLPRSSDADMAFNNLDRFLAAQRSPLSLATLFERDREALPILLQIFASSQHLSDLLVSDSEAYDLLRLTEGQPVGREALVEELSAEVTALSDDRAVMTVLRRFKRRETLRISYGDIIRGQRLEVVVRQISFLADAILEAAVRAGRRRLDEKWGVPRRPDGKAARFVVLALGKLGGAELNYSSDIDLVFLFDEDGQTDGQRSLSNLEYFERLARQVIKLIGESTELGSAYRVDMRLRPEGSAGPIVTSLESTLQYYDVLGRTWERQAFVKARPVAGDLDLGAELLARLEPWIYRRYLGQADIAGIKALKRRIERRSVREGAETRDVKNGHGGIRDIEFVIQFLQLLNGGDLPELRTSSTLEAIARLESCGCLTDREAGLLHKNYCLLRKVEHRLQIMFDLQTHLLPEDPEELRKLAIRLGYSVDRPDAARESFEQEYRTTTELNRKVLDHLLHDAFDDDAQTEAEVDLVLDPAPPAERIEAVLGRYPFRDLPQAYHNLMALSHENIRFLSTRRCRHFLAAISPRLLQAIADTPDPDSTLVSLSQVSDSLGGKGVLWELFSFNPPTLRLYVELCSSSPYLSGILISNPGMIDELLDSLLLDRLPSLKSLESTLTDLVRGAEDLDPILHSFKDVETLSIGVRDILGKESIEATTGALSDIAQAVLKQIIAHEYERLVERLGRPTIGEGRRQGEPAELIVLAMGKFGGRELNYRSDLDLIFLYEADGLTETLRRSRRGETTTNQHFFSELGQRIMRVCSHLGPLGRLYDIDPRLRPTGRSGILTTSLAEFTRYFSEGSGQLWERQALCKARAVYGEPQAVERALDAVGQAAYGPIWRPEQATQIADMRRRLEESSSRKNMKRGPGGMVDIEFIVQMLQLRHGREFPSVRVSNTQAALRSLYQVSRLERDDFEYLSESYNFLRKVEARLRLMKSGTRGDLPDDAQGLAKLSRLVGYRSSSALLDDFERYTAENRRRFQQIFAVE